MERKKLSNGCFSLDHCLGTENQAPISVVSTGYWIMETQLDPPCFQSDLKIPCSVGSLWAVEKYSVCGLKHVNASSYSTLTIHLY